MPAYAAGLILRFRTRHAAPGVRKLKLDAGQRSARRRCTFSKSPIAIQFANILVPP